MQRSLDWPMAPNYPAIKRQIVDAALTRPFCHRHCTTVIGDVAIAALIARLFLACGPTTITRFVVRVVVSSVYRVIGAWPWSHIGNKCSRVVPPAVAHCNSTPAIVTKCFALWVVAASLDLGPRLIFRRCAIASHVAVGPVQVAYVLETQAAARLHLATSQPTRGVQYLLAAITEAAVQAFARCAFFVGGLQNYKTAETTTMRQQWEGTQVSNYIAWSAAYNA